MLIFGLLIKPFFKMEFKGYKCYFNPLTPLSDQDRISSYYINKISTR